MTFSPRHTFDALNYFLFKKGKSPIYRNYKITIKDIGCNARCPMCQDWKNSGDKKKIEEQLHAVMNMILQGDWGIRYKHVQILGGEPLFLFDALVHIIGIGTGQWVTFDFPTNASLLTRQKIDQLIQAGLRRFIFSLDFPTNAHDAWRFLPGTYDKIIDFTWYLKQQWIETQWNTVIGKFNLESIPEFSQLYQLVTPTIHNFIAIEDNGEEMRKYLLGREDFLFAIRELQNLETSTTWIVFIQNGFKRGVSKWIKTSLRCLTPLKTMSYKISTHQIHVHPCYFDAFSGNESDMWEFVSDAVLSGCDICDSSCRTTYEDVFWALSQKNTWSKR